MSDSSQTAGKPLPVFPLDAVDRRILSLLGANARMSARSIAREMEVSAGLVIERIRRLEEAGVIRGYRVEVNHEVAGFGVHAFASIQVDVRQEPNEVLAACMAIPEVEVAHWTTGDHQLLLTLRAREFAHVQELLRTRLRSIPGIQHMTVAFGLAHRRRVGGQYAFTWQDNNGDGEAKRHE